MWDLLPGWSLDLTVSDPDDGEPWDFNKQEKRDKAESIINGKKALLFIGSPMQCYRTGEEQKRTQIGKQRQPQDTRNGRESFRVLHEAVSNATRQWDVLSARK